MKRLGSFLLIFLFNMLMTIRWSVPAWILLACHFAFGWRLLWFWIALGLWLLSIFLWMKFIGFASKCGEEKVYKENKNPYSKGANTNV